MTQQDAALEGAACRVGQEETKTILLKTFKEVACCQTVKSSKSHLMVRLPNRTPLQLIKKIFFHTFLWRKTFLLSLLISPPRSY